MSVSNEQETKKTEMTPEESEQFRKAEFNRRFRHGTVAVVITITVIVAVVLLNVLMTAISNQFLWYIDLTGEVYQAKNPEYLGLYSLTDSCKDMLSSTFAGLKDEYAGEDVKVDIIFCDDPDVLLGNSSQRMIYYTALNLQKAFPQNIKVQCIDIYNNASAVQKYKANSASNIYSSQVIIASGTEFRILSIRAFFVFNDDTSTTPWAYNGEKYFTSSIIAVTKAEAPICAVTNNHGEIPLPASMWSLLENAGYKVMYLNLETDEVPDNCRLMVTYGPTQDFKSRFDGDGSVSEIEKLDRFLDKTYAYCIFFNPEMPVLTHLEEYLTEWGIVIDRTTDGAGRTFAHQIRNQIQTLTADGFTFVGEYSTVGSGSGVTNDMRSTGVPAKVVFKNTGSISYDRTYITMYVTPEEDESLTETFQYAYRYSNGVSRTISNVFLAGADAAAYIDNGLGDDDSIGNKSLVGEGGNYPLMTLTTESHTEQESSYTSVSHTAFVLACASTDFASDTLLQSEVYGNADVLLGALRSMGKEVVAVNIPWKPFNSTTIKEDYIQESQARTVTVVMALIPAVLCLAAGVFVVVRRRFA
ncbi:MAG: Gldg family protein [Clostridia bacterium]|nr:Gldg family protein [Clostridia bacterium]